MNLVLAKELFVVPEGDTFLLYVPLSEAVLKVNGAVVEALNNLHPAGGTLPEGVEKMLLARGAIIDLDQGEQKTISGRVSSTYYKPTYVTLFTTFDCNLRCTYCYSEGGMRIDVMPENVIEAAIRTIIDNALSLGQTQVGLGFHGGGEPFYADGWHRMKHAVEFARAETAKHCLKLNVNSASNGVLSQEQLEWIKENLNHLNLSIDGFPKIQDAQRPMKTGHGSSSSVERTIAFLEEHGVRYGIRSTITRDSVNRMVEIVRYFRSISSVKSFHLEPLFECGRCITTKIGAPDHPEFAKKFIELLNHEVAQGVEIYYSGGRIGSPTTTFCGASGTNFTVTPTGLVTACHEVSDPSDSRANHFIIGEFDEPSQSFKIDEKRRQRLQGREVGNLSHCTDCFAKFNCAGDCPAKSALAGDMFDSSLNDRCSSNRLVVLHRLTKKVDTSNAVEV